MLGGEPTTNATLHNFDYIAEKDIRVAGGAGQARWRRAIPYVISPGGGAYRRRKAYTPPKACPAAGRALRGQAALTQYQATSPSRCSTGCPQAGQVAGGR